MRDAPSGDLANVRMLAEQSIDEQGLGQADEMGFGKRMLALVLVRSLVE